MAETNSRAEMEELIVDLEEEELPVDCATWLVGSMVQKRVGMLSKDGDTLW